MKIFLLPLLLFLTSACYCQHDTFSTEIDRLLNDKKRFGRKLRVKDSTSSEAYQYHKQTKEVTGILLIYPWDREMKFYVLNGKLARVDVGKLDEKRKKIHYSYYYLQNDTVVSKKEALFVLEDISDLLLLFEQYKKKAEKLKAEKQI